MREKKTFCISDSFSISRYIKGGRNRILDTNASINNPYGQSSEIVNGQILYSYLRYTDRFLDVFLVDCCNVIRASWEGNIEL